MDKYFNYVYYNYINCLVCFVRKYDDFNGIWICWYDYNGYSFCLDCV